MLGGSMAIGIKCRSNGPESNPLGLVYPPSCSENGNNGKSLGDEAQGQVIRGNTLGDDEHGEIACQIFFAKS